MRQFSGVLLLAFALGAGAVQAGTPYGGTNWAIPGTIQAENFDTGGEGVGYHDTSAGNSGNGTFRNPTDVDIVTCTDTGGGYAVGYSAAGEWREFTSTVATTGIYTLTVRTASSVTGGTFHVNVDGVNVTGTMTAPNTGSYNTWQTVTKTGIVLTAGTRVIRFVTDTVSFDHNWIAFALQSGPYGGTAWAIPGTIHAEKFDTGGEGVAYHDTTAGNQGTGGTFRDPTDVDIEACSDTGGGYDVGNSQTGEWLEYIVNVASTGSYDLTARVASPYASGFHLTIDGTDVTGVVTTPVTGGWQTWGNATKTGISLTAGTHLLRFVYDITTHSFNVNYISFVSSGPTPTATSTPTPTATSTSTPTPTPTTPPSYTLTVGKTGTGTGTVTSDSGGINCGSTCSASYTSGTVVVLTASASTGTFAGWNGSGCTGTSTCSVTMSAAKSVTAVFSLAASGTAISSTFVGNNLWYAPATGGGLPDATTWTANATSKSKFVRIGGNEYDNNMPSNAVLEGWVNQIKAIGAVPLIQIPHIWSSTPSLAAAVVTYFNITTGNRVDYWSIGNEMNFAYGWTPAQIATLTKNCASAMKAVDPTIKIYAVDENYYNTAIYYPLIGGANDITGKDANGNWYIDGINFHVYPNGNTYTRAKVFGTDVPAIRANVVDLVGKLATANTTQGRTGSAKLGWGLTEFNVTYANPTANGIADLGAAGFMNGQFHAEVFGIGTQYGATNMSNWSMYESSGDRSAGDLGFLDGPNKDPRSTLYHMQMMSDNIKGYNAATTSSDANVDVFASKSDSQIAVMLMNETTTTNYGFTVRLNTGTVSSGTVKVTVDAGLALEYSDTIPNQSTMVLVFDPAGNLTKKITYSLTENLNNQPPIVH